MLPLVIVVGGSIKYPVLLLFFVMCNKLTTIERIRWLSHPGMEGAGTVEEVGSEVTDVGVGDRVCYAGTAVGSAS